MWVCLTLHIVVSVGRRSSVLKVKTTPPAPEVASMKRARSASRPSAMKRKVLMDDSMVLLGEYDSFFHCTLVFISYLLSTTICSSKYLYLV